MVKIKMFPVARTNALSLLRHQFLFISVNHVFSSRFVENHGHIQLQILSFPVCAFFSILSGSLTCTPRRRVCIRLLLYSLFRLRKEGYDSHPPTPKHLSKHHLALTPFPSNHTITLLRSLFLPLSASLSTSGQSVTSSKLWNARFTFSSTSFSEIFLWDAGMLLQEVVLIVDQKELIARAASCEEEEEGETRGYSITIKPGFPASKNPVRGGVELRAS